MGMKMEVWQLMLIVIAASIGFCVLTYLLSYGHERCCGITWKVKRQSEADHLAEERNGAPKVPTKTFKDSCAPGRDSIINNLQQLMVEDDDDEDEEDQLGQSSKSNRSTSSANSRDSKDKEKRTTMMCAAPRCVLCSKKFEIGENVTHASNPKCDHEFHEKCLYKHWNKNKKDMKNKCPVCKETYVVESVRPSKHFSTIMFNPTASAIITPFDAKNPNDKGRGAENC